MDYPEDLCKLVIKNMDIIAKAPSVVESIEDKLFTAINDRIKERVEQQNTWTGFFDLVTKRDEVHETSFRPNSWPINSRGKFIAWYMMGWYGEDIAWLSNATNVQGSSLALSFRFAQACYNMKLKAYKSSFASFYENNTNIQAAGFILPSSHCAILLPFNFDADALAEEYPDFDEALKPLDDALDSLFRVHKEFDDFVKSLGTPNE